MAREDDIGGGEFAENIGAGKFADDIGAGKFAGELGEPSENSTSPWDISHKFTSIQQLNIPSIF